MQPVSIVTIKSKLPLFKGEEKAERIELIELNEVGFELVSQKDLYQVGDKAIYIQPDFCLPDTPLFEGFIRPGGDSKKCILGANNRIRAKKFNFHRGDNNIVYSNGILLRYQEVKDFIKGFKALEDIDLTKELSITKYEEQEGRQTGVKSGGGYEFPSWLYKTDEDNIHNIWSRVEFPIDLVGTLKVDGSSITIGVNRKAQDIRYKNIIASRKLVKPLFINKCVGARKKTLLENLMFWKKHDLRLFKEVENDDDFVKYGLPYLKEMLAHGLHNVILRGELNGANMKGSGNKNNPSKSLLVNIKFFGVDIVDESGVAKKCSYQEFKSLTDKLKFERVDVIFEKTFNSKEELLRECKSYFKNNLVEGIVVRSFDSKFSAKVMNEEYDSKK